MFLKKSPTHLGVTALRMFGEDSFAVGFPIHQGSLRSEFSHENQSFLTSLLLNSISPQTPHMNALLKAGGGHFRLFLCPWAL